MKNMHIKRIDKETARIIVETKHYSGKLGIFWEGFGLYNEDTIIGVCCFGQPSAPIQKHAFKDRNFRLYELTRLVIDSDIKNGASMLIAGSLKQLKEKPAAIISYADSAHGHCGIVYQATNWLYTGAVKAHDNLYEIDGKLVHPMTLRDKFGVTNPTKWAAEHGIKKIKPKEKHRYFQFIGTKTQIRMMQDKLSYPIISKYPKKDKTCYHSPQNCSEIILKNQTSSD